MSIVDFELRRYVSDSLKVADRLVGEAEEMIKEAGDLEEAKAAGIRAVEAWMILNSAAVVATRVNTQKSLALIRQARNRIMAMGGALQKCGIMLQDARESTMAFLQPAQGK